MGVVIAINTRIFIKIVIVMSTYIYEGNSSYKYVYL